MAEKKLDDVIKELETLQILQDASTQLYNKRSKNQLEILKSIQKTSKLPVPEEKLSFMKTSLPELPKIPKLKSDQLQSIAAFSIIKEVSESLNSSILPVLNTLNEILDKLNTKLLTFFTNFKNFIAEKLENIFNKISNRLSILGKKIFTTLNDFKTKIADFVMRPFRAVGEFFRGIKDTITGTFSKISMGIGKMFSVTSTLIPGIIALTLGMTGLGIAARIGGKHLVGVLNVIKDMMVVVKDFILGLLDKLDPILKIIIDGFIKFVNVIAKNVIPVFKPLINAISNVIEKIVPLIKDIIPAVINMFKEWINVIKVVVNVIKNTLSNAFGFLNNLLEKTKDIITSVVNGIVSIITTPFETIKTFLKEIRTFLVGETGGSGLIGMISETIKTIIEKISNIISTVIEGIPKMIEALKISDKEAEQMLTGFQRIKLITSGVLNLTGAVKNLTNAWKDFNKIGQKSLSENIKSGIQKIGKLFDFETKILPMKSETVKTLEKNKEKTEISLANKPVELNDTNDLLNVNNSLLGQIVYLLIQQLSLDAEKPPLVVESGDTIVRNAAENFGYSF